MMVPINTVRRSVEKLYSLRQITVQERSEAHHALTFHSTGMEIDSSKLPATVSAAVEAELKASQSQPASN